MTALGRASGEHVQCAATMDQKPGKHDARQLWGASVWRGSLGWLGCVMALVVALAASLAASATGSGLPDGRGWELVSSSQKDGGDVMGDPARVRVASDGTAVDYSSLREFGDSAGGGIATEYMAVRSPAAGGQGWVTHGIIPSQAALTYKAVLNGFEPRYEQDLSPDASTGVLFAWRPLTSDPLVANVANLYLRTDLLAAGGGQYTLITSCPLCLGPLGPERLVSDPIMVAATPDLRHILFESGLDLAPGASGGALKLYQWDAPTRQLSLAGVLPDGRGAPDSAAGVGHGRFAHRHAISDDGRKVFFEASPVGVRNVYMRLDESTTVQLNRSELTGAPDTPQTAQYGDASADGSRVFFTTDERLTDDAPTDVTTKLYVYDTTKPDSDPHNLTYIADFASAVVGASADGHTVYFADTDQLVSGLAPLKYTEGLFVWHDGQIGFVADVPDDDAFYLTESGLGKTARVSPSGDVAFLSSEPKGANVEGSCPTRGTRACDMLYVYRSASRSLSCASCSAEGAPPSAGVLGVFVEGAGGSAVTGHLNRTLTDDGHRVFFTTADALVPEDVNGKDDAYEYDVLSGTVSLISSGRSTSDAYFMETTPNGNDAYFVTREQLVGWDRDSNYDLYDARVGGGFREPTPIASACTGEDCLPSIPLPQLGPAPSELSHSAGNVPKPLRGKPKRCRRGFARKRVHGKVRCIKRSRGSISHARRARSKR